MTNSTTNGSATATLSGDPHRFPDDAATLYDEYGALAYSLAYRIVGDRGIAEDVVQEAFLAVWRNAHRYDAGRGSMRSWLCQVVRNRAIDRTRGTSRRQRGEQSLDELSSLTSSTDVVAEVVKGEERRSVVAALAALPAGQRQAIELAYFEGYSQTEIAVLTARPLGTVKSRTRAAMRALAESLASLRSGDSHPGALSPFSGGDGVGAASAS